MSAEMATISAQSWGWMVLVGSLSVIGFWAQTAALQWIDASILSSLKSLEILFAYLVQIIFMHHPANPLALLGSSLVMLGVLGIRLARKFQQLCCCCSRLTQYSRGCVT